MTNPSETLPYHSIPQNKLQRKQLTNWSRMDVWFLVVTVLAVVLLAVSVHPLITVLVTPVLVALNVRIVYGRMYAENATGLLGLYQKIVLQGVLWQATDESNKVIQWLRSRRYHFIRREKRRVIPLRLEVVEARVEGVVERFGLLHQLDRGLDHLYIAADGGDFARQDVARQHAAINELANTTNQVVSQTDLTVGVSYLRITSPADFTKLNAHLADNINPVIFDPSAFDLDESTAGWVEWMRTNINQLQPTAQGLGAASNWFVVVVTIKRAGNWKQANRGTMSDADLYELPIVQLGRAMVEALENAPTLGLVNVRCLGLVELASLIRSAWDVTGLDDYFARRAAGEIPRHDEQLTTVTADDVLDPDSDYQAADLHAVVSDLQAWPTRLIKTANDHLQLDGNFISVLRVVRLPEMIRADQFRSLHYQPKLGRWTRMAMTGETVSGDAETRQVVLGQSALENITSAFFSNRVIQNPKLARRRKQLAEQADAVSANSVGQHFNFLYPVVAGSLPELDKARRELKAALTANGFYAEVVRGSARQMDAVISGILGANRL